MQCTRPVCFFAHTMQQLRLGSLPASLRSAEGAQFAAYYGGPAYGRMRSAAHGHASAGEVTLPPLAHEPWANGSPEISRIPQLPCDCTRGGISPVHDRRSPDLYKCAVLLVCSGIGSGLWHVLTSSAPGWRSHPRRTRPAPAARARWPCCPRGPSWAAPSAMR